jgi:integrase
MLRKKRIAAFAGIRSEEIAPEGPEDPALEWRDIVWDERQIFVREEVSKTRGRYVPMSDNLLAWLAPWHNAQGRIFAKRRLDRALGRIAQAAGVTWKHNALRHSFGTYRMALIKNVAQAAEEMGNSIAMVRRHYQRPMLESVAKRWFSIRPAETNVIAMSSTG